MLLYIGTRTQNNSIFIFDILILFLLRHVRMSLFGSKLWIQSSLTSVPELILKLSNEFDNIEHILFSELFNKFCYKTFVLFTPCTRFSPSLFANFIMSICPMVTLTLDRAIEECFATKVWSLRFKIFSTCKH